MRSVPGKGNFACAYEPMTVVTNCDDQDVFPELEFRLRFAINNGRVIWLDAQAMQFDFLGFRYAVLERDDRMIKSIKKVGRLHDDEDGEFSHVEMLTLEAKQAATPDWASW